MDTPSGPDGHAQPERRADMLVHGPALAVACLLSYSISVDLLGHVDELSRPDDLLGGMWAVIATVFVYRTSYTQSITAAVSRAAATLVSFTLCFVYLVILPFHPWGLTLLIGAGAMVVTLLGRPQDTVTTGITTAVVMVVAALNPHNAWEQPILRVFDTGVGVAVAIVAGWIGLHVGHFLHRLTDRSPNRAAPAQPPASYRASHSSQLHIDRLSRLARPGAAPDQRLTAPARIQQPHENDAKP